MKIAAAALGLFAITGCAATGAQQSSIAGHNQAAVTAPALTMPDRISGDIQLSGLDDIDRMRIARRGALHAAVRVCAAPDGRVSRAEVVKSSGNESIDSVLVSEFSQWTYRPYKPTYGSQVCETVHLDYRG